MSLIVDGTTGVTFNDSSLQGAAASPYVLKNRIINGGMQVWQRGTTTTLTGYSYTTADRWAGGLYSTSSIYSQSTSVPTTVGSLFQYSLRSQRAAASTSTLPILTMQTIESNNCFDLSGQTVTLSFWAKAGANFSSSGNVLTVYVVTGTAADQGGSGYSSWTGVNYPVANGALLTTTWTKYTYTGTFGSGVLEAMVHFNYFPTGTAGADDSFYITGVQLEIGSTATPFERRLYNQELANCQRYCCVAPLTTNDSVGMGYNNTTTSIRFLFQHPVTMRAAPSFTSVSPTSVLYQVPGGTNAAGTALAATAVGPTGSAIDMTVASVTVGQPARIWGLTSGGTYPAFILSAEL